MGEDGTPVTSPSRAALPATFITALRELEPRPAAMLVHRLVEGHSLAACATHYAIPPDTFSVHLLRAALALTRRRGLPAREPASADEETAWARRLAEALERQDARFPAGLAPVVETCRELQAQAGPVATGLEAAEQESRASPRRRREEWLRRLAVALLLGLTAWLYLSKSEEPAVPRQRPPVHKAPARP
ncbi:hypothetical protein LILAB_31425 [Corallococcus macrosporus]|uniref:Uncharacterized protein n=1 Tax=Myxococcus fulvus (strain ATCC BAA-855 / HW-1) TaxID=483219 RepID=F8C745_MYXFH|nr:hypothetical protein LILAB_31425 [Corallococcus macrosporus]